MVQIKVGEKVPSFDLYEDSPDNIVNIAELCAGMQIVIFAVPGAFTPNCSTTYLPGYLEESEASKTKGFSEVICISVNDPFVMSAWGKQHETDGKVRILSDPEAAFTKEIGLGFYLKPLGGIRSKRYSMVVDNGIIKQLISNQIIPVNQSLWLIN